MRRHGDPSLNAALADSTALSMSALVEMTNNVVYNQGHDLFIDCIEEKKTCTWMETCVTFLVTVYMLCYK